MMKDTFARLQFMILGSAKPDISANEYRRIKGTISLVPPDWKSILDVGCGDGRVGNALIDKSRRIIGVDWSTTSLSHCNFERFVCDIRTRWPLSDLFDGVICAEVLEHLPHPQIDDVLKNIRAHCRYGFIVTVPAHEPMEEHILKCERCQNYYHCWGHLHRFESFEDVDELVNAHSIQRVFIPLQGKHPSSLIARWRNSFGYQMIAENSICPYCGNHSERILNYSFYQKLVLYGLTLMELSTNFLRSSAGWFACRYEV